MDKTIKTTSNENRMLTIISRITRNRNSALVHPVLWAHSPDTGLEHSTSQICFTRPTLCSSSAQSPLLFIIHSPRSPLCCAHWIAVTRLSEFFISNGLIYCLLYASNLLCCSSQCWVSLEYSVSFLHGKVLAALMSVALRVATLLGADALCYSIYKYSKISFSSSGWSENLN